MSKVQDDEVGDGTTSVTVLAAELLRVKILPSFSETEGCEVASADTHRCFLTVTGGRASDRQEDSPTDHHLGLEEGDSGGQRRSEGRCRGPQVRL